MRITRNQKERHIGYTLYESALISISSWRKQYITYFCHDFSLLIRFLLLLPLHFVSLEKCCVFFLVIFSYILFGIHFVRCSCHQTNRIAQNTKLIVSEHGKHSRAHTNTHTLTATIVRQRYYIESVLQRPWLNVCLFLRFVSLHLAVFTMQK